MVYPFLLMISGSTKSAVDIRTSNVIPRFLSRRAPPSTRKHVEGLFNERLSFFQTGLRHRCPWFRRVDTAARQACRAWPQPGQAFLGDRATSRRTPMPWATSERRVSKTMPLMLRALQAELIERVRRRHRPHEPGAGHRVRRTGMPSTCCRTTTSRDGIRPWTTPFDRALRRVQGERRPSASATTSRWKATTGPVS